MTSPGQSTPRIDHQPDGGSAATSEEPGAAPSRPLAALQIAFWRAVRGKVGEAELEDVFVSQDCMPARERMQIYRRAYWARQERVLREIFPRLRAVLGDSRFGALSVAYLRRCPSDRPAIEWIGQRFAQALAEHSDLPDHLIDVAKLEWARMEVLLAPDAQVVADVEALRGIDFARARAALGSSVRLACLDRMALEVWHTGEQRAAMAACKTGRSERTRVGCVVWRQAHHARHRALDVSEHQALARLAAGHDFASVCTSFPEPGAAQAAARAIGRWLRDGLLSAVHPS